jgi:cell division septation protein DedD
VRIRDGADSAAKAAAARGATTPAKGASHAAAPAASTAGAGATTRRVRTSGYTVQVAAYQTQSAAQALVDHLRARGFVARIYGTGAPFRVRVGRFASESQADSAARSLKSKGVTGFVTPSEASE